MCETVDYIVIGAGSAGCVVAGRLSESSQHQVALIEAGRDDNRLWVTMPLGFGKLYNSPQGNWAYESEPEPGLLGARSYQPRGKLLGGTGSINGMVYMRGRREDYDHWAELGCSGWGYEDVLPYFRKSENNERGSNRYHGVGGPISVVDGPRNELGDGFLAAAEAAGYPLNEDHSGAEHEGFGYAQWTGQRGRRSNSDTGFLRPALRRSNFRLISHAQATRIIIRDGRAVGVEYVEGSIRKSLMARREVVLCGGAFNSPQLLQLSGIGPAELLKRHGIPVIVDLPGVGENLQDHFGVSMLYRCSKPITIAATVRNPVRLVLAGLQYFLFGRGLLATNGNICVGYLRGAPNSRRPDSAVALVNWARASVGASTKGIGLLDFSSFTLTVSILQPESRGSVRIRSSDPTATPEIRFNFFEAQADHAALTGAIGKMREVMAQPAIAGLAIEELAPGPDYRSRDHLIDYCRRFGRSTHHAGGTCKMGVDPMAVVDPRLRVIGIDRLRVADASVMPFMVCGNINAPIVMIGEKAAAMILEDA